jgi:predicted MPP superfamily phosphohydrolase
VIRRGRADDDAERAPLAKRAAVVIVSAATTVFLLLVWHDLREAWFVPENTRRVLGKLFIYWGMWLLWPAMGWLAWQLVAAVRRRKRLFAGVAGAALACCAVVTWARFVEPAHITVRETRLGTQCGVSVALVSDIHMGLFMREDDLQRIVEALNGLPVDAVLVAGDWTYEPPRDLARVFAPLSGLKHPVIAVLGNHDEEMPGPPLTHALREALVGEKVMLIDGRSVPLGRCELMGAGDLSAGSAYADLKRLQADLPTKPPARRVLLTHNPDVALDLPKDFAAVTLAGHTHGGQIRLPYFTERLLLEVTRGGFEQGLYDLPRTRLFITPGLGIDKLPMRLGVPPTIDMLML